MKKIILFNVLALCSMMFAGCGDDDNNSNPQANVKDISYGDCKNSTLKSTVQEYIDYKATPDKYLDIKHVNVMFNCCPGKLTVNTVVNNDTIKILEEETEHDCNCVCNYDLSYKIGPLEYKKYHVILVKGGLDYVKFTLDFKKNTNGKVGVNN